MEQLAVAEIVEEVLEKKLGDYVSRYLAGRELELERIGILERLIRLEEELKAQRELMEARFEAVDRRFEDLIHYMDRRFEDLIHHIDQRFEDMNRRFTMLTWLISSLFGALAVLMTVFKFIPSTSSP